MIYLNVYLTIGLLMLVLTRERLIVKAREYGMDTPTALGIVCVLAVVLWPLMFAKRPHE